MVNNIVVMLLAYKKDFIFYLMHNGTFCAMKIDVKSGITLQICRKIRGLGCVTSAPAPDDNRDETGQDDSNFSCMSGKSENVFTFSPTFLA